MRQFSLIVVLAIGLFSSCHKNAAGFQFDENEMQISIRRAGGWCAGNDLLKIGKNKSIYIYRATCKSDEETLNDNTVLSDWNELTALLDTATFKSVNLNACGICYDGTDEWVSIKYGNFSHAIRYDKLGDPKLDDIRPFIDKLRFIRDKYKTQFQK